MVQVSFKCVAIAFYHLPDGVAGRLPSGSRGSYGECRNISRVVHKEIVVEQNYS